MKLSFIEVAGFRGFREKIRVELDAGFTVICGRNGVGKSTLCDAIEFGLTGAIDKYRVEKAAKESLADYLWWRGGGAAPAHYVSLGFRDENEVDLIVTRSREAGADTTVAQLETALCTGDALPDDAIRQLVRTSLIRDEWIAALSLDLTETERFEVVRAALGAVSGPDYPEKAKNIESLVGSSLSRASAAYESARNALNEAIERLAQARDATLRLGDVSAAMARIDAEIASSSGQTAEKIGAARAVLTRERARLNGLGEAISRLRELIQFRRDIDAEHLDANLEDATQRRDQAQQRVAITETAIEQAQRRLIAEKDADSLAASLSALIKCGEHLGLDDGHCPLCAAARSSEEFLAGLAKARARLDALGLGLSSAERDLAAARQAAAPARAELEALETALAGLDTTRRELRQREQAHIELFDRYQFDYALANDLAALERQAERERNRLIDLERAILTVDASLSVQQIENLEERVRGLRAEVDRAADATARTQRAASQARTLERGVRRAAGEIIDERLALINPLLNELYQRLRPHTEWRSIEYDIRGDVRRFLSLRVGDNLNPQFVFSSGQRRAAGLAFLLSVHLARSWCRWNTLILDDPVQHIDDYRALHLVEILSALRLSDRQIICAVEDRSLADLLCRRLGAAESVGRRIDLEPQANGIAAVHTEVPPLAKAVLPRPNMERIAG
jgi:chromosome segregation protein